MKRIPLLILLSFAIFGKTFSQQTCVVISNDGLKLREKPNRNGRVLAVAPFGAKVQVLTVQKCERYGHIEYDPPARRDTIGELQTDDVGNIQPHIGYWWKVRYAGRAGYMFSGFLADSVLLHAGLGFHDDPLELNDNFRLRDPWGNAGTSNNPEFDPSWNWYGLFQQDDGRFEMKKVNLRYAVQDNTAPNGNYSFYTREIVTFTDQPKRPCFIFGTRQPWKERKGVEGYFLYREKASAEQFVSYQDSICPAFLAKHNLSVVKETCENGSPYKANAWFIKGENGRQQRIVAPGKWLGCNDCPTELTWYGDLDGDGKKDYIFGHNDKSGYSLLYLTSQAGKGEIARLVAVLWTWYTC